MAGVGALRRGISRRGGVLHLWRDRGGLDGVHKVNRRKGARRSFFSATLSAPRPGSRAGAGGGGRVPFAAPLCRQSPRSPPRGSARMSEFPRPLLALHPRRLEPGKEECVARRGRSSRRSAGRDIRRTAGRASWCSLDLGLGPPGGEIALVRVARPGASVIFRPEPGGWPGAGVLGRQRPGSGFKRPPGRPSTGIPWPGLSRSPAPRVCRRQREEARRLSSRICPCPTRRRRRTHRGPFRAPALPILNRPRRLRSATQPSAPMLRENVCILERAICARWVCPPLCPSGCAGWLRPHRASAATFLRIAHIRPPAGKGVPALRLGVAALPRIVAVLPLVEPKHVAASLRRSLSRGYVGGVFCRSWSRAWRFRGPVLFRAPLGGGRSRSLCQSPGSCWPSKPTKPR